MRTLKTKFFPQVFIFLLLSLSISLHAQKSDVDITACQTILQVLKELKNGASKGKVISLLDSVFKSKPYITMFKHYNRSWRPNHLPDTVFRNMILSLKFKEMYREGTNTRADQMLPLWKYFYDQLELYERNIKDLQKADLTELINNGVKNAQEWLPDDWKLPEFYFFIHPNGGSSAFTIENCQGYDFFDLPRDSSGNLLMDDLIETISHETHHLGIKTIYPNAMSSSDSVAFEFLIWFIGEGTATKLVNNADGGCVPKIDANKTLGITKETNSDWNNFTLHEKEIFSQLFFTIENAHSGKLSKKDLQNEMRSYWLSGGRTYRIYFIGSELFGAIYHGFGKDGVFTAMKDPRKIFELYNNALKSRPDLLGSCITIPDNLVKQSLSIGGSN